jgi:hypothetical protein
MRHSQSEGAMQAVVEEEYLGDVLEEVLTVQLEKLVLCSVKTRRALRMIMGVCSDSNSHVEATCLEKQTNNLPVAMLIRKYTSGTAGRLLQVCICPSIDEALNA